jgi:hypothetical protein
MPDVVIDTNVPMVANGLAVQADSGCIEACVDRLIVCRAQEVLLIDDGGLILEEYRRHLAHSGQPGPGDAFFKWLWDNQANESHCRRISITPIDSDSRGFEECPADQRLATFDPSDRKFLAVAIAAGSSPSIVNASDTDWWTARHVLADYGVTIEFVCPQLMQRP